MSVWIWGLLFLTCFAYEMFTLASRTDGWEPLTYYIRKMISRGPLHWLLAIAVWLWLGYHLFVDA